MYNADDTGLGQVSDTSGSWQAGEMSLSWPMSLSLYFLSPIQLRKGVNEWFGMGTWCLAKANPPEGLMVPVAAWAKAWLGHHRGDPSPWHWWSHTWSAVTCAGLPSVRETWTYWRESKQVPWRCWRHWRISPTRTGWESGDCSPPRREGSRSHQGIEIYEGMVQRGWSQVQTYSTFLSVIWARESSAT